MVTTMTSNQCVSSESCKYWLIFGSAFSKWENWICGIIDDAELVLCTMRQWIALVAMQDSIKNLKADQYDDESKCVFGVIRWSMGIIIL